jgi:hypothetical protein
MAVWFRATWLSTLTKQNTVYDIHMKGKKILNPPTIYYNGNEPNQTHSNAHIYIFSNVIMITILSLNVHLINY